MQYRYEMQNCTKEKVGERIRKARYHIGKTQQEVATESFMTEVAVSKIERGCFYPDAVSLCLLSQSLQVSVDEILAGRKPVSCIILLDMSSQEKVEQFKEQFNDFLINGGKDNDESEI